MEGVCCIDMFQNFKFYFLFFLVCVIFRLCVYVIFSYEIKYWRFYYYYCVCSVEGIVCYFSYVGNILQDGFFFNYGFICRRIQIEQYFIKFLNQYFFIEDFVWYRVQEYGDDELRLGNKKWEQRYYKENFGKEIFDLCWM